MHELSIAHNLITIAEQSAIDAGAIRVTMVYLRLGVFAGVVKDALLFAYDIASAETLLADSQLIIEDVPLIIHCDNCKRDVQLETVQLFCCPDCGAPSTDIRSGREIEIVSLEIYDETPVT